MKDHVFPHQVLANDIIVTHNGVEVVYLTQTFLNDTVLIRFKTGRKIICYSNEVLEVVTSDRSYSNLVNHNKNFNKQKNG
jgi:hypothetical protein